jgi:Family of unknown function (DUF6508)
MSDDGNPDDATLVMALDLKQTDAWRALVALDEDFRVRPHADDDCVWPERPGHMPYPDYGPRVQAAWTLLGEVGAVTPSYHWMQQERPVPDHEGKVSAADAVRLATTIIRSERFGDGNIGAAVDTGVLQAVITALATWYRERLE